MRHYYAAIYFNLGVTRKVFKFKSKELRDKFVSMNGKMFIPGTYCFCRQEGMNGPCVPINKKSLTSYERGFDKDVGFEIITGECEIPEEEWS